MSTSRELIHHRLARIEGQVRGLMKMVDEDRECIEVLTQVAALRAALNSVGSLVFTNHVEKIGEESEITHEKIQSICATMERFLK